MTATVVDLFPKARESRHDAIESAVEAVESLGTFTRHDVYTRTRSRWLNVSRYGAACEVIAVMEREGLIRRVSDPHARPVVWRVAS